MKSKKTAIILCLFLGVIGIHRFYLGHTLIGVVQLLTLGGFGIWALIDFFRLIFGSLQVNTIEDALTQEQETENIEVKPTNQREFINAFDVLGFEGLRWNLFRNIKTFNFYFLIIIICYCFYSGVTFDINAQDEGFQLLALIISFTIFILRLIKKTPAKVNLSLDDDQKEKLKNILESIKKVEPITMFRETKVLNQGETGIGFVYFVVNGKSAFFLPEGIAYGSGKNFELLDYKNLSVKQETIEVVEDKLPKGANAVSDRIVKKPVEVEKSELPKGSKVIKSREKKTPVYGGWTHENKDGSKDSRYNNNPRKVDYYNTTKYVTYNEETKYVKYIKTDLNIDKLKIELLGDYKFPSLKTKKEKESIILREMEEEEKRKEQESIKETLKREQESREKEKEKEERDRKQEWEKGITDKLANVSVRGKSKGGIIKELTGGNLSNEQKAYLERIVNETIERDKIKKEQEYIQNKKDFFKENNLTIMEKGKKGDAEYPKLFIRDENYEEYEFEEDRMDFIVYKPEGMRGKRAYIKTDSEKNYLTWSGPINKEDKSKFLRGDFGKVKEESQPKEEVPVQEKGNEEEKIESPKEQTDTNDSPADISANLERLTNLYNDGVLTKEEFKKKSDELIRKI
jgi:TM2 domain-containing membrane protein YozV